MKFGTKFNPTHMATLEKIKPPEIKVSLSANTGSVNPFPTRVAITLNTTAGKPRLTNPSKIPVVLGIILKGLVFRNFATPNPPLNTD